MFQINYILLVQSKAHNYFKLVNCTRFNTRYLRHCYITASEESPLHSTTMSKTKHSGENVDGVTMQMRFIPLKTDPEKETQLGAEAPNNYKTRIRG